MADYFALLSEPRRPWLDADALKLKFLALSATAHPDKVHAASTGDKAAAARAFAELNAAYNCLAEPKSRLLHLLELESGARPPDVQEIPPALADLFADVATVCRATDGFLAAKAKAKVTSPLVRVQWFEQAQDWVGKLNALQQKLNGLHAQLMDRLKTLDDAWSAHSDRRKEILPKIEELYRLFAYFNRWNRQIQERVAQLYEG